MEFLELLKEKKLWHIVPYLATSLLLLLAVLPLGYDYYEFLRIVVFSVAIFSIADIGFSKNYSVSVDLKLFVLFLWFIVILFNPIVPVHLTKDMWRGIDLICALFIFFVGTTLASQEESERGFKLKNIKGIATIVAMGTIMVASVFSVFFIISMVEEAYGFLGISILLVGGFVLFVIGVTLFEKIKETCSKIRKMFKLSYINFVLIILLFILVGLFYVYQRGVNFAHTDSVHSKQVSSDVQELLLPNEYRVEVYQLGGQQIRDFQITAWLTTEQGYLHPVDEYANAMMNVGGDYVWLNCREGYMISECEGGIRPEVDESGTRCSTTIEDIPKTRISFLCSKK